MNQYLSSVLCIIRTIWDYTSVSGDKELENSHPSSLGHVTLGSDSLSVLPCDVLDLPHLDGLKLARKDDLELAPLFLLLSLPIIFDTTWMRTRIRNSQINDNKIHFNMIIMFSLK